MSWHIHLCVTVEKAIKSASFFKSWKFGEYIETSHQYLDGTWLDQIRPVRTHTSVAPRIGAGLTYYMTQVCETTPFPVTV